jgi:hypothetical protein
MCFAHIPTSADGKHSPHWIPTLTPAPAPAALITASVLPPLVQITYGIYIQPATMPPHLAPADTSKD